MRQFLLLLTIKSLSLTAVAMAGNNPPGRSGRYLARSTSFPGASTDGRGLQRVTPSNVEVEAILQLLFPEQPKAASNSLQAAKQVVDATGRKTLKDSSVSQVGIGEVGGDGSWRYGC